MNKIDFNQVGGFPMTTNILAKIQTAFSLFNALGNIVGDLTIISGCEVVGTNVTDGVVFINNEVLEFRGGLVQTKVTIKEDTENLTFQNGNSYPSIKTRYATFGTGVGAINWADFKRGFQTKGLAEALALKADDSVVTAIADAVALIITKLNTIETGAEKNVQDDWLQTDSSKDDFIKNKPATIAYLAKGSVPVSDFSADSKLTITFSDVGTSNYVVVGSLVSTGTNWDNDNDVIWMVRAQTSVSFDLLLRETGGSVQSLKFNYALIPL
jgi:hypothetical protein